MFDLNAYAVAAALAVTAALAAALSAVPAKARATRRARRAGPHDRPSPRPCGQDDFGLLRTVALVENLDTGRIMQALLTSNGVPATVSTGRDGLVHVLVFPDRYDRARRMVGRVS